MQTDKTQHAMESCVAHSLESLELIRTKLGVVPNLANLVTILTSLSDWQNLFAYNELSEQILVMRQIPGQRGNPNLHRPRPIRDDDISQVIVWLNRSVKMFRVAKGDVADAVRLAARENVISPIKHYLQDLERIPAEKAHSYLQEVARSHFGIRCNGVSSQAQDFAVLAIRKFLISAVARALRPGCKVDHILIWEGGQGVRKSSGTRALFGDAYFGDNLPPPHSKDASDYIRGLWGIELAELSNVSKAEVEHVKAFVTRTEERFRPAYGHNPIVYLRRCVFIGTTNRSDYLRDETGNRRFWPVKIDKMDVKRITDDRDKIWGAAVSLFEAGEQWWLTQEETKLAETEQAQRTAIDAWYEDIGVWLDGNKKQETCIKEVAKECFLLTEAKDLTAPVNNRIRSGLAYSGFESSNRRFSSGTYKGLTIFVRKLTTADSFDDSRWDPFDAPF
jgi:predicted P-loop ATPase